VNGCSSCSEGFSFNYDPSLSAGVRVEFGSCVDNQGAEHCLVFNSTDSLCVLCEKGFSLNVDGVCELVKAPNCEEGRYFRWYSNDILLAEDEGLRLFLFNSFPGCVDCLNENYVGLFNASSLGLAASHCMETSALELPPDSPENTVKSYTDTPGTLYIEHCLYYTHNAASA
jgi:hypothetical protein